MSEHGIMKVYHLLFLSAARCYVIILWKFSQREVEKCIYYRLSWQRSQPATTQEHCCIVGFRDWWMAGLWQMCRGDSVLWGQHVFQGVKAETPLFCLSGLSHEGSLLFSTSQGTAVKGRWHRESVQCHQAEMMGEPGAMHVSCWGRRAETSKGAPLGI